MRAVLAVLAAAIAVRAYDTVANLTLLTDSGARCMDGTLGGFYYLPAASQKASRKWVINLEGGGECTTQPMCQSRLNGPLGSSKYFSANWTFGSLLWNRDPVGNPAVWDWNMVQIPYCSQDLWTGTVTVPSNETTFGLYFSGHWILDSVVRELLHGYDLDLATDVVLTGESAGGIGVTPNLDWLAEVLGSNVRVVGAPVAGLYYFADPYTGPGHTTSYLANFEESAWPGNAALWQSFVDKSCLDTLGAAWRCVLANYSEPFIDTPLFFTQSLSDQVVLTAHDWVPGSLQPWDSVEPYIATWQHNMTVALDVLNGGPKRRGYFGAACFIHTSFSPQAPLVEWNGKNISFAQGFSEWYNGETVQAMDHGGVFSNPTCPD
jgi:O-palmitoleoyl-L-serine hydrolase